MTTLLIAAMAAAGYVLTMAVLYPGLMTNDATYVYQFMQDWRFGDWQSPLMSMLWWVVDPIAPGPGSMFLLIATVYWLGFAVVALTVARRSMRLALIVPLLALVPPAFMLLGMIWRDVLFGVVWLLAAAIAYASVKESGHDQAASAAGSLSRRAGVRGYGLSRDLNPLTPALSPAGRGSPAVPQSEAVLNGEACANISQACCSRGSVRRWAATALALVLIGLGVLLRPTSFIAAPLIAAYAIWPRRLDWKRAAIAFVPALALGYALVLVVYYVILDVKREHPLHSVFVFDLGGITHFTGENQFPVSWSAEETALLTTRCYNPDRWDSYWTIEPCRFVMARLERPDDVIFGTDRLTAAWTRAVAAYPLAYLRHRLTYFWTLLADPNTLTLELYHANDPAKTPLAENRYFKALLALHDMLTPTMLFRPGFWLVLAAMIGGMAAPRRSTPSGAFAMAVTGSAIVYMMTFLPFGVAADFRYGYWCVLASLVGAVALFLAYQERRLPVSARPYASDSQGGA